MAHSYKKSFQLDVVVIVPDIGLVWFMVFNATFKSILVISRWSVLLVEETGAPVIGITFFSMGLWPPFLPCQWDIFDMNGP
jgi:hypothetical protein